VSYEWDLAIGDVLSRAERARRFGGATLGGIQPSRTTPNVFVYSDPARGHRHGYVFDGWVPEKNLYLYTGEGRVGPQRMAGGNRAILNHQRDGKALRLFVADGVIPGSAAKLHRYVGEFVVDPVQPHVPGQAPDDDDVTRSVIVFRLRPVSAVSFRDSDVSETGDVALAGEAAIVELEVGDNTTFPVAGTADSVATRREHDLVQRFIASLGPRGADLKRWKLRPPGLLQHLFTDLYDAQERELFEVKATNSREAVRVALGQLLDYRQWIRPAPLRNTVVISGHPPVGMIEVLNAVDVGLIYEDPDTKRFVRHDPPARA
jgi:hypothetical protein